MSFAGKSIATTPISAGIEFDTIPIDQKRIDAMSIYDTWKLPFSSNRKNTGDAMPGDGEQTAFDR